MLNIIDGKRISQNFCDTMRAQIADLKQQNIIPHIALINTNQDPASKIYVSKKKELAESLGIKSTVYTFDIGVNFLELKQLIDSLNCDISVNAILLQSPIPSNIVFRDMVNVINPDKDVDGLTTLNQGRLFASEPGIVPCTPLGVMHLIRTIHKDINGMHAIIIGRSTIVGRPLSQLLLNANCTVTLLHSYSKNLSDICKTADILICATGTPGLVDRTFVKPGATVIDVGINRMITDDKKKIIGDVNFDDVKEIAGAITPVPNGVGPMTVAYLMHNTIKLACINSR